MDIFEKLRSGADVDMATPEYAQAIKHMTDCANICFKINTTAPTPEQIRPLEEQLFEGRLDQTSYLMPPLQIDFACQMKIGRGVFVNHSLTCMAAGGITIDDGVMIGPNVRIVTDNHDFRTAWCCVASPSTSAAMPGLAWVPSSCPVSPSARMPLWPQVP